MSTSLLVLDLRSRLVLQSLTAAFFLVYDKKTDQVPNTTDPQKPHPETDADLGLRGGRSDLCPGRFCFCVPCPLPCDCCII